MSRQHPLPTKGGATLPRRVAAVWPSRALAAAGALALAVGAAGAVSIGVSTGAGTALAAPVPAMPAPAAPGDNELQLSATPANGLPVTNAEINVKGAGFDPSGELWIAVCQDDGAAPEDLSHCLGGAIPDANASSAWAVVTPDGVPRYPGPVNGTISANGSFDVSLQVPVASGQDADCVSGRCSVFTRSADPNDRTQDASVPVGFSFSGTSSPTGNASSTQVIGAAPTTVAPDSVSAPQAELGSDQTVVFSGFTPGEIVDVALYSDPIPLESVQADQSGLVRISFTVPPDLPLGEHLVQAIGSQSARVGVAQFTVIAAADSTTSASPTDTAASTAESTTSMTPPAPSADPTGEAAPAPVTTEPPAESTADTTATLATVDALPASPPADSGGGIGRLVWLWIVLVVLVAVGGAVAIVAMLRRRGGHGGGYEDPGPVQPIDEIATAPSWQQAHDSAAEQFEPDSPGDPAEAPDTAGWAMFAPDAQPRSAHYPSAEPFVPVYSGEEPFVPAHTYRLADTPVPAQDSGPATEQWRPVFDAEPQSGEAPSETGQDPQAATDPGPTRSPDGGRHRSG